MVEMNFIRYRPDPRVERVMRELGFDELAAKRHVEQLDVLRARLAAQRRYEVDRNISAFGKL
jgi:hypothetical protein